MIPGSGWIDGSDESPKTWQQTLDQVVETMKELSLQDDPQAMVRSYGARVRKLQKTDAFVALSRRGLEYPRFRVTRSSYWTQEVDPWKEKDKLPILEGGLLSELIYGDTPRIIDDLRLADNDPARPFLGENRSLMAIPHYDRGEGLNMTISLRQGTRAFDPEQFPSWVWMSSLFGRATQNLVLSAELKKAYDMVERELKIVADIQRSLLPQSLPQIPTWDVAAFYQTSRWAGGDYYDFFPLPDGKWGVLIADVSGHGTPAAVLMAVTHSLAHGFPGPHDPPSALLNKVNHQLSTLYTADNEAFVTAFYGIYDPSTRRLSYSSAGHNPPRLRRCGESTVVSLDGARRLPLGLMTDEVYEDSTIELRPGDRLAIYTDGITEAISTQGELFGTHRLDDVLAVCRGTARELVDDVVNAVSAYTADQPPADDQTLLGIIVS